jgi:hypothetical protein
MLACLYELEKDMIRFFNLEKRQKFCDLLQDDTWHTELAYLTDMFEHLNKVNSSIQERNESEIRGCWKLYYTILGCRQ